MLEIITSDLSVASITNVSAKEPIKEDEIFMLEELDTGVLSSFSPSPPASPCSSEDENCQHCLQCGREFVGKGSYLSISSRSTCDPQLCKGCRKLFTLTEKKDIVERFDCAVNRNYKIEARFLQDWYLHQYNPEKQQKDKLYHLPLSEHYYSRRVDENKRATFTYFCSRDDLHKIEQYVSCHGCREFVKTKQRTLRLVTDKKCGPGRAIAELEELFELLVNSKSTCSLTGMKGSWAPFPTQRPKNGRHWVRDHFVKNAMFFLSLDHIIPLAAGGSSHIGNLQVTLQGFNHVKAHYSSEDFQKWLKAFMFYQGY
ncbi:uncharacterized protein ATC70_009819 [Mucor velutinosus]|uniref:Uncharacterized protein n=1 Tax=Mucor velutinosus TaxID=708070 RepID=A0AAN7DMU6_9FUNG|nr:hypothetical protein ATC70_009819 [Mucor velutinosus]